METLDSGQKKTRDRFDSMISLVSPALDLVLNVGERISRVAESVDHEYYPIRSDDRGNDGRDDGAEELVEERDEDQQPSK